MPHKSKLDFMKKPKPEEHLNISDVSVVRQYYKDKYGINIILKGESELGKSILRKREEEIKSLLGNQRYAFYLLKFWRAPNYDQQVDQWEISNKKPSAFNRDYLIFKNILEEFLDQDGNLKKLDTNELEALNDLLNTKSIKYIIDEQIELLSIYLFSPNNGLSFNEALLEISSIQNLMKPGELVGYVYTSGRVLYEKTIHFEVLIITHDLIIKPIIWTASRDYQITLENYSQKILYATADVSNFFHIELPKQVFDNKVCETSPTELSDATTGTSPANKPYILPQAAGTITCATLGMIYLKELLKDDCKQLKELSLIIPYYNTKGIKLNLFIPPPQVLRYSHSTKYNLAIKAMVEKSDNVFFEILYKSNKLVIKTAQSNKDDDIVEKCKDLLIQLPEFRKKWLLKNELANEQRKVFYLKGEQNLYLAYKSNFFKEQSFIDNNKVVESHVVNNNTSSINLKSYLLLVSEKLSDLLDEIGAIEDEIIRQQTKINLRPAIILLKETGRIVRKLSEGQINYTEFECCLEKLLESYMKISDIDQGLLDKYNINELINAVKNEAKNKIQTSCVVLKK